MRAKLMKTALTAAAAGIALATGPGAAPQAAAVAGTRVPCSASALAADITADTAGATLQLAPNCTYLLTSALPDVTADLTLVGTRNYSTIRRSSTAAAFSLLHVTSGAHLRTDGVNFTNGDGSSSDLGGAIYLQNGSVTVTGGTFSGNTSGNGYGGAIDSEHGPVVVTGATFTGNTSGYGGAIDYGDNSSGSVTGSTFTGNKALYGGGAISAFVSARINNDTFTDNAVTTTGSGGGGALYTEGGTLTASQDTFTANTAYQGGAIAIDSASTGLVVNGGYFQQNTASEEGGAIRNNAAMTLNGPVFSYNHSAADGGAVYIFGPATVTGATFAGNSAPVGGGLYDNWTLTLSGSTLTGNTAADGGGGLYNRDIATVSNTSFTANSASTGGGGIQQESQHPLTLTGSRVEYNHAPAGAGGGILDSGGTVTLSGTTVAWNQVNNCSPAASVAGCAG